MSPASLLILDDDCRFAAIAGDFAREAGFSPCVTSTLGEALAVASRVPFQCVLVDIGLPDGCGLELLSAPHLAGAMKIVMSGDESLAAWAGRRIPGMAGALGKPFRFAAFQALLDGARPPPHGLVGDSPAMQAVVSELLAVAPTRFPVLIHGESGTGKELAAKMVHVASRRTGSFVAVNCATLSPDLMSSQLFGHRRGSFTGAVDSDGGLIALAEGGTLFLDELAEAPASVQAALLRFLESGEVRPLGSRTAHTLDVRIVAATNVDPSIAMATGRIRADLYFRVAGYEVRMPPLRERPSDIEPIAQAIVDGLNREYGTQRALAPGWQAPLRDHGWPGNVRELRQRLQRAWLRGQGPLSVQVAASERAPGATLEALERAAIAAALDASNGDRAAAAVRLGISERTIYNRLARYRRDD